MSTQTKRIDRQRCSDCKRSRFVALSAFGPDIYRCTLANLPVAANHSCGEWQQRDSVADKGSDSSACSSLQWMSIDELNAEIDWQPSPELTAAFRNVREQMAEQANSEQANRERLRDAQATADFLRQPVLYSQDCRTANK
jgi:hypothetical protein